MAYSQAHSEHWTCGGLIVKPPATHPQGTDGRQEVKPEAKQSRNRRYLAKSMQIRLKRLIIPIAVLLASISAATAQEQRPSDGKTLPLHVAIEAAQAAIDSCAAKKVAIHVYVMDSTGNVRLLLIPDGAHYDTLEGARRKGYTAAMTGEATIDLMKRRSSDPSSLPKDPKMVFLGGAVPIKRGSEVIGVLSAGGGAPEQDAECAQAGVDQIQAYLN